MNEVDNIKTGKLIAELRKKKGLTQGALAELIDASTKAVSKWETGNGFPEIYYQHKLCEFLGITIEELHCGDINTAKRNKIKFYKKFQLTITVAILIILPILISLLIYFCTTYNSLKYYKILVDDTYFNVNGIIVEDKKAYTLYIGDIDLFQNSIKSADSVSIDLFNSDLNIYHTNNVSQAIVKFSSKKLIDINKIKLIITITSSNGKISEYETNLKVKEAENDILIIDSIDSKTKVNNTKFIEDRLIKNGFKKVSDVEWKQADNKDGIKKNLSYFTDNNKLIYSEKTTSHLIMETLYFSYQKIDFSSFDLSGEIQTLIENYEYNLESQGLLCHVGLCSSVDQAKEIYEKYYSLLFVD